MDSLFILWTFFLLVCYAWWAHFPQLDEERRKEQSYIRSYVRRNLGATWCGMLCHNMFACARDTREGLRSARVPLTG